MHRLHIKSCVLGTELGKQGEGSAQLSVFSICRTVISCNVRQLHVRFLKGPCNRLLIDFVKLIVLEGGDSLLLLRPVLVLCATNMD